MSGFSRFSRSLSLSLLPFITTVLPWSMDTASLPETPSGNSCHRPHRLLWLVYRTQCVFVFLFQLPFEDWAQLFVFKLSFSSGPLTPSILLLGLSVWRMISPWKIWGQRCSLNPPFSSSAPYQKRIIYTSITYDLFLDFDRHLACIASYDHSSVLLSAFSLGFADFRLLYVSPECCRSMRIFDFAPHLENQVPVL